MVHLTLSAGKSHLDLLGLVLWLLIDGVVVQRSRSSLNLRLSIKVLKVENRRAAVATEGSETDFAPICNVALL
jgi:hypothetical protein